MTDRGCHLLRKASNWKNNKKDLMLPFHVLCNSVWDMAYGFDEMYCAESQWVCPSKWIQYNRTDTPLWNGQCAPRRILCDGQWDLPNAYDEFNCGETSQTSHRYVEIDYTFI